MWTSPQRTADFFTFTKEILNGKCHFCAMKSMASKRTSWGQIQKQPFRGVLEKKCCENMQQIYRRTPMRECNFDKVAKQLYWNRTSAWLFSWKFCCILPEYLFNRTPLNGYFCKSSKVCWTEFKITLPENMVEYSTS